MADGYSTVSGITLELALYMIPHFDVATFDFWREVKEMELLSPDRRYMIHSRLKEIFWYRILVTSGVLVNHGIMLSIDVKNGELLTMSMVNMATQERLEFL